MLCTNPTNDGSFLVKDTHPCEYLVESGNGGTSNSEQLLRTALKGKELKNLSLKELKSELDMRGLTKAGNKAALSERLKSAILNEDSRPSATNKSVAKDIEAVKTNVTNPRIEIVHNIIVSVLLLKILNLRYVTSNKKCPARMIVLLKQAGVFDQKV